MFHPALLKLLALQWYGGLRRFVRSLKTIRGLIQMLFSLAIFAQVGFGMVTANIFGNPSASIGTPIQVLINDFLAVGLFALTSYMVLFSTGDATVYFTASEVAFLFPGPFSRKQLLTYKLLSSLLGLTVLALIMTLLSVPPFLLILPRFVAVLATFMFVQLLGMNVAFTRQVLQEKVHVRIRQVIGIAVACFILAAVSQMTASVAPGDWMGYVKAFRSSAIGTVLLAPFQIFVRAIQARDWQTFGANAAILVLVDIVLLTLAFRMDALSLEAAFAFSEKMTERLKRLQTKGIWHHVGTSKSNIASRRVPMLPFWMGIGPILWQRVNTTIRISPKMLLIPIIGCGIAGFAIFQHPPSKSGVSVVPFLGMGILFYASFMLSLMMQNDIDQVAYFKSLPISSRSIVIGDLIGFPILLSIVQSLFFLGMAVYFRENVAIYLGAIFITPFVNFLMFGIDKLIFYIYPTRMAKGAPGDLQASGKQMIFMAMKMLLLAGSIIIVVLATLPGMLLFDSALIAWISVGLAMAIECVVLVPFLTAAFNRFDPGSAQLG